MPAVSPSDTASDHAATPEQAVRDALAAATDGLDALRQALHRSPELSFAEHETSERIRRELDAIGIPYKAGFGAAHPGGTGTGIVAHLPATHAPRADAVALRADIDALPIAEQTGLDYASEHAGVMHACGHDGHTAILIGAARALARLEHRPNPVTFIFQPGEENGGGGACMVRDGVLKGDAGGGLGPPVARIYGLHGWPNLPLGQVSTRPGPLLAATDDLVIRVRGVEGHAAYPHLARDPVVASAHIITALQTFRSRATSPLDAVVATIASIHAGSANNVIPGEVVMQGTVRTLTDAARLAAKPEILRLIERSAEALGCDAHVEWNEGYPVTRNDETEAARVLELAATRLGPANAPLTPEPSMGGEDFSYYAREIPACFFLLGLMPQGGTPGAVPQLHQATFDFNDDALPIGVDMMLRLALTP